MRRQIGTELKERVYVCVGCLSLGGKLWRVRAQRSRVC